MACIIKYVSDNHLKLKNAVHAIGFDSPKKPFYYEKGVKVRFAGWIIPKNNKDEIKIVGMLDEEEIFAHKLDIKRRDVEIAYNLSIEHSQNYGFSFDFIVDYINSIFLFVNNLKIKIWHIDCGLNFIENQTFDLSNVWINLHKTADISKIECESSIDFDNQNWQNFLDNFLIVDDYAQLTTALQTKDNSLKINKEKFNLSIDKIKDCMWSINAIEDSIRNGQLTIDDILSDGEAYCYGSIASDDFNYLFFKGKITSYYLTQQAAGVVSIIFPFFYIIYSISIRPWVLASRKQLINVFKNIYQNKIPGSSVNSFLPAKFIGLNISMSRPAHYFYDYVYGLEILNQKKIDVPNVFSLKGHDFIAIGNIYSNVNNFQSFDCNALNSYVLGLNGFLISPCVQYTRHKNFKTLMAMTDKIISFSTKQKSDANYNNSTVKNNSTFILWIGISIEKRAWIEQIEGFSNIIMNLKNYFPELLILVDGRTFPLHPRKADINHKQVEDEIYAQIKHRCTNVNFINLIGLTPIEKIYYAEKCSCFITHYLSDSLYPSCFCKKPGVVYSLKAIGGQQSYQVHHNIIEIPGEYVNSAEPDSGEKPYYEISVTMDWRIVYKTLAILIYNNFNISIK